MENEKIGVSARIPKQLKEELKQWSNTSGIRLEKLIEQAIELLLANRPAQNPELDKPQ